MKIPQCNVLLVAATTYSIWWTPLQMSACCPLLSGEGNPCLKRREAAHEWPLPRSVGEITYGSLSLSTTAHDLLHTPTQTSLMVCTCESLWKREWLISWHGSSFIQSLNDHMSTTLHAVHISTQPRDWRISYNPIWLPSINTPDPWVNSFNKLDCLKFPFLHRKHIVLHFLVTFSSFPIFPVLVYFQSTHILWRFSHTTRSLPFPATLQLPTLN